MAKVSDKLAGLIQGIPSNKARSGMTNPADSDFLSLSFPEEIELTCFHSGGLYGPPSV